MPQGAQKFDIFQKFSNIGKNGLIWGGVGPLWLRGRWAPQARRFRRTIFFVCVCDPLTRNGGPGARRPQSALIFPKHVILGLSEALAALEPDDPHAETFFWNVFIIGPPICVPILYRYFHPRLRSEGGGIRPSPSGIRPSP